MIAKTVLTPLISISLASAAAAAPLTLDEAVRQALSYDPSIEAAEARRDQGLSALDLARAEGGPVLGVQAQVGALETDFTTDSISQIPRQVGLQAEWPVYQSGSQGAAVEASQRDAIALDQALTGSRESVVLATVEAYAQLWLAERALEVGVAQVETFQLRFHETQARLEQGVVTQTDIALTEARLASAQAVMAGQRAAQSAARARLSRLTGSVDPDPISPFAIPLVVPESFDEAVERARRGSPTLAAAKSMLDAAGYRVQEARGRYGPKVSLKARASTGEDIYFFFEDPITDVGAFVTIDIPLFTSGQRSASTSAARAGRNEAAAQLRSAELQVQEAVVGLWGDLTARREALSAAERAESAAALAAEGAQREYEAGLRTLVDALDAEDAFRAAQIDRYRQQTLVLIVEARLLSLASDLEGAFTR